MILVSDATQALAERLWRRRERAAVRAARVRLGLTQEGAAAAVGIRGSRYAEYERGAKRAPAYVWASLAGLLVLWRPRAPATAVQSPPAGGGPGQGRRT